MRDLMLDLETWGKRPGCAIRSIGAVMFDPMSTEIGAEFYVNVNRESCEEVGLLIDQSTADWWSKQSRDAQISLENDQRHVREAFQMFLKFARGNYASRPWSQGANFDQPILDAVAIKLGVVDRRGDPDMPWKFWDSRCTRTAYGLAGMGPSSMPPRGGTHHNALDDAKHQARCVQVAYRRLKINSEE